MNNFAIPGFMPLDISTPPIQANAIGGVNAIVLAGLATEANTFHVKVCTPEGVTLIDDPLGERIFFHPHKAGSGGYYRFISIPGKDILPPGISVLHVLVNGTRHLKFFINVSKTPFLPDVPLLVVPGGSGISGQVGITEGALTVIVEFVPRFGRAPTVALATVIPDIHASPRLKVDLNIVTLENTRAVWELSQAPNTGGYRLAWAAWV